MSEAEDVGTPEEKSPEGEREDGLMSPLFSLRPLLQLPILGLKLREAGAGLLEAF